MAIRHISTQLCDNLIEHKDGRFSLIGMFQNIKAAQVPVVKDPMGLVVTFIGKPSDPFQVFIRGPRGFQAALPADVVGSPSRPLARYEQWCVTVAGVLSPIVFPRFGVYSVVLESAGRRLHTYRFGVIKS